MKVDSKLNYPPNLVELKHAIDIMYQLDFCGDDLEDEYENILRILEKFTDKLIVVVKQQEQDKLLLWKKIKS
jgi:hypothetical protein